MYKSALLMLIIFALVGTSCFASENVKQVKSIAGAHAKVTWCRQVRGNASDVFGKGQELVLMGLDTKKRREFVLRDKPGNYHKPLISPDGNVVVYTDFSAGKIFRVDWNGSDFKELYAGFAVDVWNDPVTGVNWVYAIQNVADDRESGGPLIRFNLADPVKHEVVWDKTLVTVDNIQLSRDGNTASALTPWPQAGIINLKDKVLTPAGKGCWTSLAPDNSRVLWVFDGAHRNLIFHDSAGQKLGETKICDIPGNTGFEVYHPRWSNRRDLFVLTGPYKGGSGPNRIGSGGAEVEVFIGKFSDDLSRVIKWARVTDDKSLDIYPDMWVDSRPGMTDGETAASAVKRTAKTDSGIIKVKAELVRKSGTPALKDILPYRQALVVYLYKRKADGQLIGVAHWGMRDGKPVGLDRRIGESYDLDIQEYSGVPELEGERVVMDFERGTLPLYYSPVDVR